MVLPLFKHIGWRRETTDPPFHPNDSQHLFSPATCPCVSSNSPSGHLRHRVSKLFSRSSRSHSAAPLLRLMLDPTYGGTYAFGFDGHLAFRFL
jgi:hypothetical protein